MNYLCIDFGGTKTLICIIDDTGTIQTEVRFETPEHYPDFLNMLTDEINKLPEKFDTGVMAIPGLIDQETGVVITLGNRPWEDFPIRQDVEDRIGVRLHLLNDARMAGVAEAARLTNEYSRVLYITVSTGIGGALAVNGRLIRELDDIEFGKMPLLVEDKFIPWEEIASGRAIVAKYGQKASEIADPNTWKEIAKLLALGVGPACSAYQPDAIVFGGGVGEHAEKFSDYLREYLEEILHPIIRQPQGLLTSYYGDESVIYGCYELGKQYAAEG